MMPITYDNTLKFYLSHYKYQILIQIYVLEKLYLLVNKNISILCIGIIGILVLPILLFFSKYISIEL